MRPHTFRTAPIILISLMIMYGCDDESSGGTDTPANNTGTPDAGMDQNDAGGSGDTGDDAAPQPDPEPCFPDGTVTSTALESWPDGASVSVEAISRAWDGLFAMLAVRFRTDDTPLEATVFITDGGGAIVHKVPLIIPDRFDHFINDGVDGAMVFHEGTLYATLNSDRNHGYLATLTADDLSGELVDYVEPDGGAPSRVSLFIKNGVPMAIGDGQAHNVAGVSVYDLLGQTSTSFQLFVSNTSTPFQRLEHEGQDWVLWFEHQRRDCLSTDCIADLKALPLTEGITKEDALILGTWNSPRPAFRLQNTPNGAFAVLETGGFPEPEGVEVGELIFDDRGMPAYETRLVLSRDETPETDLFRLGFMSGPNEVYLTSMTATEGISCIRDLCRRGDWEFRPVLTEGEPQAIAAGMAIGLQWVDLPDRFNTAHIDGTTLQNEEGQLVFQNPTLTLDRLGCKP